MTAATVVSPYYASDDMTKKFIWIGFFVGSTIGNLLPTLWGGDLMSLSAFALAAVGGIVGIWLGYRWSQSL